MRGKEVFYPIGWDDNGLATERRVQNYYGVTCDPSLPYQPDLVPDPDEQAAKAPATPARRPQANSPQPAASQGSSGSDPGGTGPGVPAQLR